jgi:hypothetical protein
MPKVVDGDTSSKTKIFDHPVLKLTPQGFGLLGMLGYKIRASPLTRET